MNSVNDSRAGSTTESTIRDSCACRRIGCDGLTGAQREPPGLALQPAPSDEGGRRARVRPNRIAAALRRQVSDTIGLVVPQISNPFFPALIEAVHTQLQASTKQLLLCDSMQDPNEERHRLQALLEHQVDGILISPCDAGGSLEAVRAAARRVPVVQMDRRISGEATDWVGVDDTNGMALVIEPWLAPERKRPSSSVPTHRAHRRRGSAGRLCRRGGARRPDDAAAAVG